MSWQEAKTYAAGFGAELAFVRDAREFGLLVENLRPGDGLEARCWLGATNDSTSCYEAGLRGGGAGIRTDGSPGLPADEGVGLRAEEGCCDGSPWCCWHCQEALKNSHR